MHQIYSVKILILLKIIYYLYLNQIIMIQNYMVLANVKWVNWVLA